MKTNKALILATLAGCTFIANAGDEIASAKVDARLRYEAVDQNNALNNADALTLRTRVTIATNTYSNFSGVIEFEDSRVVAGFDDYYSKVGDNDGSYSVIADPETTELDQAYVQYKANGFMARAGRQVITLDNHRFVGHVGWRQDRQTFDGLTLGYDVSKELKATYSYITKRNRIFAEAADLKSKDHLLNVSYKTGYGKLTGYSYMLEVDNGTDNALDTFGVRFAGKKDAFAYQAEFATQDSESATADYSATYMFLEGGYTFNKITAKIGYESLGSDDGMYGFSTPLATLHKFNGWSDTFLGTPKEGLNDLYFSVGGKVFGGGWAVIYHDFSADQSSALVDDLGSEINAVYTKKFMKNYTAGIKFANYSAGDDGAGKVDTDKVWVWVEAKF